MESAAGHSIQPDPQPQGWGPGKPGPQGTQPEAAQAVNFPMSLLAEEQYHD